MTVQNSYIFQNCKVVKPKNKQYHRKVQLNSFPLNGHTLGLCPYIKSLKILYHPRFDTGSERVGIGYKQLKGTRFKFQISRTSLVLLAMHFLVLTILPHFGILSLFYEYIIVIYSQMESIC